MFKMKKTITLKKNEPNQINQFIQINYIVIKKSNSKFPINISFEQFFNPF